jgi:hypothetical protein
MLEFVMPYPFAELFAPIVELEFLFIFEDPVP